MRRFFVFLFPLLFCFFRFLAFSFLFVMRVQLVKAWVSWLKEVVGILLSVSSDFTRKPKVRVVHSVIDESNQPFLTDRALGIPGLTKRLVFVPSCRNEFHVEPTNMAPEGDYFLFGHSCILFFSNNFRCRSKYIINPICIWLEANTFSSLRITFNAFWKCGGR
jgi:hypothetical protein